MSSLAAYVVRNKLPHLGLPFTRSTLALAGVSHDPGLRSSCHCSHLVLGNLLEACLKKLIQKSTSEIYSKISNLGAKVNSSNEEGKISGKYLISFDKADFGTKLDLNLGRTIPETSLSQEEFSNGFTQPIYIDPLHTNQTELRFTTNPSLEVQVEANKLILSGVPSSDEIIQLTLGGPTISLRIDFVVLLVICVCMFAARDYFMPILLGALVAQFLLKYCVLIYKRSTQEFAPIDSA